MSDLTFDGTALHENRLPDDPLPLFDAWIQLAQQQGLPLYESCALATVSSKGKPSVRIVLFKGRDAESFLIFSNYDSRKGKELKENPAAALAFHWPTQERQIRIEGWATRTERNISEKYFATRPRGSQIGAWASQQSEVVASESALKQRVAELEKKFAGKEVPCPPNWGGYAIKAEVIEFWQGKESRLHDRFRYIRQSAGIWMLDRLSP